MSLVVQDAFGRPFELMSPGRRIVSLVPSITETLFELGAGDQVVGVTKFCTEPPDGVRTKTRVGGPKTPRHDAIRDLAPDLVIANVEENRRADVETLRAAGLPVFVTFPRSVREGIQLIRDLGVLTDRGQRAEALCASCERAVAEIADTQDGRSRVRVFCPIWRRPYMTINADTYVHDVLRTCGGENVFGDRPDRYPVVSLAEMAAMRPDMVLLPDEPFPFDQEHLEDFRDLADVPAVSADRLRLVDGKILSWYGSRIPQSLRTLLDILQG
ncbi:MAG TPA: cobalamin-binding protein [Candidatus Methylomirabilis sp.]|nr:cobalamin-binding protein [Candidatus Methylomirabilis sp.]HSC70140.1 cobalamin-binding protein [Candidatus Methylomirabilis sp.]